jgi:acyl-coenzyme A thioesterase PaaI-like protein
MQPISKSRQEGFKKRRLSPALLRLLLNLYPPFWGAGIRIVHVGPNFRTITIRMPLRFYNRNYFGTHFGGSLFAMANFGYVLMLTNILGRDYMVWDKSASIRYLTPGRGTVRVHFALSDDQIMEIRERTASGEKYEPVYLLDIVDDAGTVIANVEQTLYVSCRRKSGIVDGCSANC